MKNENEYDDYEEETQELGSTAGDWLDVLALKLGTVPWWVLSVSLHMVLLLMLALVGLTQGEKQDEERYITIAFQEEEIPAYEPPDETTWKQRPVTTNSENITEEEIVDIEPIEFADEPTSDDNEDYNQVKGKEDAITNVEAGALGKVGIMGVGPGGLSGKKGGPWGSRYKHGRPPGSSTRSEFAVDAALRWLARHQEEDGHWDSVKYGGTKSGHDAAQTGLALLAFLGGGHTEKAGLFRKNVKKATKWLRDNQQENGAYADGWGYNHAICALAMAEAAGMARVPATVASAQKAVDYSVNIHQIGEGSNKNGWRYSPKAANADISVSGWFIMQLKSAKLAHLKIAPEAFQGAVAFLDSVEVKEDENDPYSGHRYCYMEVPDNPSQLRPTGMRTAIGVMCRQFLGWSREELEGGVNFMLEDRGLPSWGPNGDSVDWYYWYYATMVTFQMGINSDYFKQWNGAMRDLFCDKQIKGGDNDGSWDPTGRYQNEGRVLSTAMGALCLEVYYRYGAIYR